MCGIAGIVDLTGSNPVPHDAVRAMAAVLFHRGPDEDGFLLRPEVGLASRRLSIVGLADGRQPIFNEDRSVAVVYNGELFDYPEARAELESRGHRFATHTDTEVLPHRWEEQQEGMFERLRGQFAVALWDSARRRLVLGRDRFGICPLFWARQASHGQDWLLFASEIKALLASGMVEARADVRGINHLFTFFAVPGPVTCFQGVSALMPGHYLRVHPGGPGAAASVTEHKYWEIDFPDAGDEERGDRKGLVEQFEGLLLGAVEERLRADVPVVSYLSGGVDSSTVVALACHFRDTPIPAFTIRVNDPLLDETGEAAVVARHLGCRPVVVNFGADEVLATYPRLIRAAESPVVDTSCAALLLLAQEVHRQGYKVALTGEGADEWLAGYPWYKVSKALGYLDVIPGIPLGQLARRLYLRLTGAPRFPRDYPQRMRAAVGGHNPWLDVYGLMSLSKLRFYSAELREALRDHIPYDDLRPNLDRVRRWHPLNRGLYYAGRIHLPGLLLSQKGDRVAMHSSVETRYPFLDEEVFAFLARIHPRWKMCGFRDKYLLRRVAERWLPKQIAWRGKAMFRAPFDSFHLDAAPAFVRQLLSEEALRRTGYFDPHAVAHWRAAFRTLRPNSNHRLSLEMGLAGVLATQLWHQTFLDDGLADLSSPVAGKKWEKGRETVQSGQPAGDRGW